MRLGDFLQQARQAPVKPVQFRIVGKNALGEQVSDDVEAVMVFVDETERQSAKADAHKALRELYGNSPVPEEALLEEITYQVIFRALRDKDSEGHKVKFADSVKGLKNSLMYKTVTDLDIQYTAWVNEEFPDFIDAAEFEKLVEEAENFSLAALLKEHGFLLIRRALPSLAARFGK